VAASGQVFSAASRSSPASTPCSCRPLSHETLLWHHRLGHPSLPRLRGMASRTLGHERYFLLVVDDYSRYTTVFPLRSKGETEVYVAHQINLQPRVSLPETTPTLRWTGKVGDASVFRAWGSRAFVHDTSADKLSSRAVPCVFLRFTPDAPGWHFYHPASRRVLSSQDITFDESESCESESWGSESWGSESWGSEVCESELWGSEAWESGFLGSESWGSGAWASESWGSPWTQLSMELAELFQMDPVWTPPSWDSPLPQMASSWTTIPLFLAPGAPPVDPLPPQGPAPSGVSQVDLVEPVEVAVDSGAARGAEPAGAGTGGAEPGVLGSEGAEPGGVEPERVEPGGAETGGAESWGAEPERAESGGPPGVSSRREPLSPQQLCEWYARRCLGAAGAAGGAAGAAGGAAGAGATGGASEAAGGAGGVSGAVGRTGAGGSCPPPVQSQSQLQPASPLPGPSPYSGPTRGLTERRERESRPTSSESRFESPVRAVCTSRHVPRPRPPPVPDTHSMTLRPSSAPQRVPLPSPPASSLPDGPDPESDSLRAASPTVTRFLATTVTYPLFESTAASALVAEFVDFAAACRLDYATSLVAESASASVCPPSVGGEFALGTDVLEDRQEEFECFAAAVPHLVSMLLAPEGDPDAPDILTPRSYAEAIEGPYSSQWQAAMDAEMASWKSTGTYVDEVPPPGANIISDMWIFMGVDFFQTFSPTPKMTTLRVLLHVAAQRDYELHSLDFSTAFLQGSLHEEIWLRRPPGFTGLFPAGTQWSLWRPVYGLRQAPREWHDTLTTTLATLGFAPSTADPSLFLRIDTTLPPFYVLVYVENLVFATADTEALTHVKSEMQKRHTCTDLGELTSYLGLQISRDRAQRTITLTQSHMVQQVLQRFGFTYSSPQSTPLPTSHSLSAPPSVESVEPSGLYPELVGRLITSSMGLMLGGRARVVLTGHADASCVDDLATQRLSQGYTFSLGSGSVSWRSTRSSSVLSSSCEAEIYAGAMAAQELRWLTYLMNDLGEAPRSPPVLYVDNKAMLALCQEHRLEHRTKHIALRYFLARELQQRGQLRLAYVASQANTADVFTKALQPSCFAFLDWYCDLLFSPTLPMG
ncbi:unnamed protein product, partial [Closterium sp. NIES-53]